MESYIFSVVYKYRKNIFFEKNAYLNILNLSYIAIFSSNTFSSTDGILCVFSLIFIYPENFLFRLNIFPLKTT